MSNFGQIVFLTADDCGICKAIFGNGILGNNEFMANKNIKKTQTHALYSQILSSKPTKLF